MSHSWPAILLILAIPALVLLSSRHSLTGLEPCLLLSPRGLGHSFQSTIMTSCPTSVEHSHLRTGRRALAESCFWGSIYFDGRIMVCANCACLEERGHLICRHNALVLTYRVMPNVMPSFPFPVRRKWAKHERLVFKTARKVHWRAVVRIVPSMGRRCYAFVLWQERAMCSLILNKKMGILDNTCCGEVHAPIYSYLGHRNRASVVRSLCWLPTQGYISPSVNALCFLSWGQFFTAFIRRNSFGF